MANKQTAKPEIEAEGQGGMNDIYKDARKVYVKADTMWYCAEQYLLILRNFGIYADKEFTRRLDELMLYVYGKLDIPLHGDIVDDYVVYELALPITAK